MTGSLDPQGPVAKGMADLWWLMLALGTAVFVVFAALLAVALFRRRGDAPESDAPIDRWIVGWGVVGPTVVIAVVFAATVYVMLAVTLRAPADALVVEVVGRQWSYDIHYPDEGISTENELHLPTGRPVTLHLTSADVIHSFWVPQLGGKQDMLPDGINTLVLQADEPGVHQSRCAEFCGLHHTTMALQVVVEEPDQFDAWVTARKATGVAAGNGD